MLPAMGRRTGLPEEMSVLDYAARTVAARIERMLVYAPAVREGGDEDALRQMRIASRRVRAALDAYEFVLGRKGLGRLRRQVKAVTRALGKARDLDMTAESLRKHAQTLPPDQAEGIARLLEEVRAEREAAQRDVREAVDALERERPMKALATVLERRNGPSPLGAAATPAGMLTSAALVLNARVRELLSYEAVLLEPARVDDHHDMRTAVKQLRYTLEAYEPLFERLSSAGPQITAAIEQCKDLQDRLGRIHDSDVLVPWITERLARSLRPGYGRGGDGKPVAGTGLVDYQACHGLVTLCEAFRADRQRRYNRLVAGWTGLRASGFFDELRRALRAAVREAARRPLPATALRLVVADPEQPPEGEAQKPAAEHRRPVQWSTPMEAGHPTAAA